MRPKGKRPTKPPPPPPLPARDHVKCFASLPHQTVSLGGGSEYAESVSSIPLSTQSLQPPLRPLIPSCNQYSSCGSESGYITNSIGALGSANNCRQRSCCPLSCSECRCSYASFFNQSAQRVCSPGASLCSFQSARSQFSAQCNHIQACHSPVELVRQCCASYKPEPKPLPKTPPPVENITVTPKERTPRPQLSVSPLPVLKRKVDQSRNRDIKKCNKLHYIRFIEHLVMRIFKYLDEREQRRKEFENHVQSSPENELVMEANIKLRKLLVMRESRLLRAQRVPITLDKFKEVKTLGSGFFGVVSLVKLVTSEEDENNRPLFAMKKVEKKKVFDLKMMARVMAEKDILSEADSDWIVRLFYSFQDEAYLYFILEYVPRGDMMAQLIELSVFPEELARFYTAEISLALNFVHELGYVHRDVKPDNILIDSEGHIKLADFGLCTGFRWNHDHSYWESSSNENQSEPDPVVEATSQEDHPTITKALCLRNKEHSRRSRYVSHVGSLHYMAPEVIKSERCANDKKLERLCDWWSVGIILYEMVVGYAPFRDLSQSPEQEEERKKTEHRIINWRKYFRLPPKSEADYMGVVHEISDETKGLIQGLICDSRDRLCQNGIQDLKNHAFFKGIDWDNIRSKTAPHIPPIQHEIDTVDFGQQNYHSCMASGIGNNSAHLPFNDFTYRNFYTYRNFMQNPAPM